MNLTEHLAVVEALRIANSLDAPVYVQMVPCDGCDGGLVDVGPGPRVVCRECCGTGWIHEASLVEDERHTTIAVVLA
jgi:hypothetical protein